MFRAIAAEAGPLVGRSDELAVLRAVTLSDARAVAAIIGGEAGVGKTRLLSTLLAELTSTNALVLVGNCLDLGDSTVPYLPISDLLGRLAQDRYALVADLAREQPQLSALLPEFFRVETPVIADRAALFDAVHMTFERLAADQPLVIVIEDAHWADRSTRDLLTVLMTRRFKGPVSILVSYRSDDLHRKHPMRATLAEWSRLPGVQRLMLEPLANAEIDALLRLHEPALAPDRATDIVRRACGNPFFAEELLAAGDRQVPDDLADLMLLRMDSLSADARQVVNAAAVAGRSVSHSVLVEVVDLDDAALNAALRSIIDVHLMQATSDDGYAFRHALLGEAVLDDLLPGERVALHRRFTDVLRSRSGHGVAAALARHARGCAQNDIALSASIAAGEEAMAAAGPAEAARHFEDALWLAAGGASGAEDDLDGLTIRTASALIFAGDAARATELLQTAYDKATGSLADQALLLAALGEAQFLSAHERELLTPVAETIASLEGAKSAIMARLKAIRARQLFIVDDFDGALLAADEALDLARALELPDLATDAMTTIARLEDYTGATDADETITQLIARAADRADIVGELRGHHQLARILARREDLPGATRALELALERACHLGVSESAHATEIRGLAAHNQLLLGRFAAARRTVDLSNLTIPPSATGLVRAIEARLLVATGQPQAALSLVRSLPARNQDALVAMHTGGAAIDALGALGDVEAMVTAHDEAVTTVRRVWNLDAADVEFRLGGSLISQLADNARTDPSVSTQYGALVLEVLAKLDERMSNERLDSAPGWELRAWHHRARAEAGRMLATSTQEAAAEFDAAATLFEQIPQPYDALVTRLHLARMLGDAGDVAAARAAQTSAMHLVEQVPEARWLVPSEGPATTERTRLTPREMEVLQLVADGRTNGEIAATLFISTKTASVHVSNILAKLAAPTRTRAAAIAQRDGLVRPRPTPSG